MMRSIVPSLEDVVQGPVFNGDEQLFNLLKLADKVEVAILFIADISNRNFIYMSPTCFDKIGYRAEEFIKKGSDFIYQITLPDKKLAILEKQVRYLDRIRQPDFDPSELLVMEFPGGLQMASGANLDFYCMSIALTYTSDADIEYGVQLLTIGANSFLEDHLNYCRDLMRRIKARHNDLVLHSKPYSTQKPLRIVHLTTERMDHKITNREAEVLKQLANGLSTKEIATMLCITNHTVESYRKKLLEKFTAKNTAELIKKASKVFWLE